MFDLGHASRQLQHLVSAIRDDQLAGPTPCPDWAVADLLAHVHQFATVFTCNARKEEAPPTDGLPEEWRSVIPRQLEDLAVAWRDEAAWVGRTSAGGVDMDAADNAVVAMEELVVHSWDLARASGQEFRAPDAFLDVVDQFFELFAEPIASGKGPYGPEVPAPEDASRLERTLAHTGRDPLWSP